MSEIFIGPCKCGGYGQCFDNKTEAEIGRCHIDLYELAVLSEREACAKICDEQAKEPECPERAQYCAELIRARSINHE